MNVKIIATALASCLALAAPMKAAAQDPSESTRSGAAQVKPSQQLAERQQAILPITGFTASGDIDRLKQALERGLDAGMTINETRELLVQMYAYTGFPRSLNALSALMDVLDARSARGIDDPIGAEPGPLPAPEAMLEAGTANQTTLIGAPATGALFDFAPQVDRYLKEHLFGAIFARGNVSWIDRELATLGALSMLPGAESQLGSHMRVGRNVGLTEAQLQQVVSVLRERVSSDAADRAEAARQSSLPQAR